MIYNMISSPIIDFEDVILPEATYEAGALTYGYVKVPAKAGYTPVLATLSDFGVISNGVYLNTTVHIHANGAVYFHVHNPYSGPLSTSIIAKVMYIKNE